MPRLPNIYRNARPPFTSVPHAASAPLPGAWRGKGFLRLLLLLAAAALVAAVAANFGIARDYGYLRASILTGTAGGHYHTLARSEEHTSELQSLRHLVCRLLLEKKKTRTDTSDD